MILRAKIARCQEPDGRWVYASESPIFSPARIVELGAFVDLVIEYAQEMGVTIEKGVR